MKVQVPLKTFAESIMTVGRATSGRSTRPVLANVLLIAEGNELKLAGTDLEILITSKLPAKVITPGTCTISARILSEMVTTLPVDKEKAEISFEHCEENENLICVTAGNVKSYLPTQGVDQFPPLPVLEGETFPSFDQPALPLKKAIKETSIAMGTDDNNPNQRSICLTFENGNLRFIATDSRRMSMTEMSSIVYPPEFERSFIIPSRAVLEIIRILENIDTVKIGLFKEQLLFITPQFLLLTRLYDGKFPDFRRILPKEYSKRLFLKAIDLERAIKALSHIAKYVNMMINFEVKPNETKLWAESKEEGRAEVFLNAKFEGDPINIAFSGRFINDFLGVCDAEQIRIDMTTPNYPGVFKPMVPDSQFTYALMPMSY